MMGDTWEMLTLSEAPRIPPALGHMGSNSNELDPYIVAS